MGGLAQKLGLKTELLTKPIKANALDGNELFTIAHVTEPLELHINEHKECMNFYLFKSPSHALILGYPWLLIHNPQVNWKTGKIMGWGDNCAHHGVAAVSQETNSTTVNIVSVAPTIDSEFPDLSFAPSCYHHLHEVFNKTKAMSLPPHRAYDCAIDLIPGSTIPKSQVLREQ